MVRIGDPATTLRQFPLLWQIRHDTGRAEVAIDGPGRGRVSLRGYVLVSHEICKAIEGTISELLRRSGAADYRISKAQCRAADADMCIWNASWRP
jgi:hypothetical protein